MADITCTNFDDLYDPANDEVDETRPDIRKNLLEDFAAPTAKLTRESVAHSREHMQVHLRVRPFTNREKEQGESQECMEICPPSVLLMRAPKDSFTFKSSQRGFSSMTHKFTFSRIFGEDTSQKEFFDETMLGTVKDFIDGQNCLVFTYGVTNAGKTYTIQGVPQDGGILPRSLDVIFNSLEGRLFVGMQLKPRFFCDVAKLDERQRKKEEYIKDSVLAMARGNSSKQDATQDSSGLDETDDSRASCYTTATEDSQSEISVSSIADDGMANILDDLNSRIPDDTSVDVEAQGPLKFSVWVSFAEIYNEYMYDLLEAIPKGKKARRQPLKFSEDKHGQIYIKGLKEISVQSADEAYKVLKIGQQNLSMAATKLNHCSSRSHCIFSVKILRVVDVENPHVARVSQLSFCDLAGSERYTRTQNTGERLKEAGNINTSLLTLGKCIHTLRYNQNHPKANPKIIPFRESKLTRLFQSFFMGKGKASMVVNVNQCASGFDETIQVLKFSAIAKQVTTVTSKLDNKWKVPMAGAGGPKLASSRALSLALRQSLSRGRASVAWATPGPQPDANLDLTTVDESLEDDDEDEDEDEMEEDEEEEEDGQRTPRDSVVNQDSRAALIRLVEMLKTQLIEEKKRMIMLEVQIREEVCQEMAQQLVQIEGDYRDQLEKERLTTEEMFEKRLEMYENYVKDVRKRPRPDDKDAEEEDEEDVTSRLLHAEQAKVQSQENVIGGLRRDVDALKEALEESHDKMNSQDEMLTELRRLAEASKEALGEAEAKLRTRDERLEASLRRVQELENIYKESTEKWEQARSDAEKVAYETDKRLALKRHAVEELEDANEELEDANRRLQQQLGRVETGLSESESSLMNSNQTIKTLEQDIDKLRSQLEDSQNELRESKSHPVDCPDKLLADKLQEKVTALEKEIREQVAGKEETLGKWHEEKDNLTNALEQMEHKVTALLETQKSGEFALAEKDEQNQRIQTQLSESESTLKDSNLIVEALEQDVDELKSQLEDSQKQCKAAKADSNDVRDLKTQLSESESSLMNSNQTIQTLEQDIDRLRSQLEESQNELRESKSHPVDCPDKLLADKLQEKVTALEKEIKEQVAGKEETLGKWHEEKDNLTNALEQMEHKVTALLETQRGRETALAEKDEQNQRIQTQLSESESTLKDSNLIVEALEQDVDELKSQLEDSQKQCKAAKADSNDVRDLKTQLSESESSLMNSNQTIKTLEQDIDRLRSQLEDSRNELKETKSHPVDCPDKLLADKLQEKVTALEKEIKEQVAGKEETLGKWHEEKDNLTNALEQMEHKVTALLETQRGRETALAEKDERIQHLETQVSQSESNLKDSNLVIKTLGQNIDTLRGQLEESQKQNEEANADTAVHVQNLETRLCESESSLKDSNQTIEILEQDIDKLRSRLEDSQTENEVVSVDKNEIIRDLETRLSESESSLRDSNQTIETLEQDIDTLRSRLEDSQKHNEASLSDKMEHLKDLRTQLSESESNLKDSNQVIKTLRQDIDKLRSRLEDSQTENEVVSVDKNEIIRDLETLLSESELSLVDSNRTIKTLKQDIDKLRSQLEESQKHEAALAEEERSKHLELRELASSKEETLGRLREEHDHLVMALDARVTSLIETQAVNETALSEKDDSIQHLKTQLSGLESSLRDSNQTIVTLEQDIDKLRSQLEDSQNELKESKSHPVDCPDKLLADKLQEKVTALEKEVMKQVANKEETLAQWRSDRDGLVTAMEQRLTSLLETREENEASLAEKDEHIGQLKAKLIENISDSQSVTDDESDTERGSGVKTRRGSRKGRGQSSRVEGELQREMQELREQLEKERSAKERIIAESERSLATKSHAIQELEAANRHLQQQLGLIEVTVDVKPLSRSSSESSATGQSARSPSPKADPDSPDLFMVDVKDQESFHQPGKRRTRVEMDVTPLQKKQPVRKTRATTRKAKKRKSTELLEEVDIEAFQKRSRPEEQSAGRAVRSTRKRNARANRGETDLDQAENTEDSKVAEPPSASNRGKRAALSRIGDLLQNTPLAKSAKKLVESATAHLTSPSKSPDAQEVTTYARPTTEKKRKRRLLKTDISVPFESSPFEVLNVGEPKNDNSHSIVTRKLRSRNTRV